MTLGNCVDNLDEQLPGLNFSQAPLALNVLEHVAILRVLEHKTDAVVLAEHFDQADYILMPQAEQQADLVLKLIDLHLAQRCFVDYLYCEGLLSRSVDRKHHLSESAFPNLLLYLVTFKRATTARADSLHVKRVCGKIHTTVPISLISIVGFGLETIDQVKSAVDDPLVMLDLHVPEIFVQLGRGNTNSGSFVRLRQLDDGRLLREEWLVLALSLIRLLSRVNEVARLLLDLFEKAGSGLVDIDRLQLVSSV